MHLYALRHTKCGVEANAELADELGVLFRIPREILKKRRGTRFRYRAQVFHDFVTVHADTVVADPDRGSFLVYFHANFETGLPFKEPVVGERRETQFVDRVRRI